MSDLLAFEAAPSDKLCNCLTVDLASEKGWSQYTAFERSEKFTRYWYSTPKDPNTLFIVTLCSAELLII